MIIPWIILAAEGVLCKLISSLITESDPFFCSVIILINSIAVIFTVLKSARSTRINNVLVLGFLFRLLLLIWDLNFSNVFTLPNSGKDTVMFANAARSGFLTGDYHRGGVYAQYIAFVYRFFGIQIPIAQYTNILLSLSMIYYVLRIMEYIDITETVKIRVIELLSLLPNTAIISSILLREALIAFLVVFSIYYFMRWICQKKVFNMVLFISSALIASMVHSGSIAVIIAEAIILIIYDRLSDKIKISVGSISWMFIVVVVGYFITSSFSASIFGKFQGVDSIEEIVSNVDIHSTGRAAYSAGFSVGNSTANLIINTPIRMFYFLLSPLPWNWRNLSDIIAFCFSSTFFFYAIVRGVKEIRVCDDEHKKWIIVFGVMGLIAAMVFAWGVSNSGTAVRHREKFISVYALLIAVANDSRVKRLSVYDNS